MANISNLKKGNINIDMTPMVDLGFLLITFFMLSTTFSTSNIITILKPSDDKFNPPLLKVSKTLTIILGKDDKVYYYIGSEEALNHKNVIIDSTNYVYDGI